MKLFVDNKVCVELFLDNKVCVEFFLDNKVRVDLFLDKNRLRGTRIPGRQIKDPE